MKLPLSTRTWRFAAGILVALLSGPVTVLVVVASAGAGFVVPPGSAPRFSGPQGREGDITELVARASDSVFTARTTIRP